MYLLSGTVVLKILTLKFLKSQYMQMLQIINSDKNIGMQRHFNRYGGDEFVSFILVLDKNSLF